MKNIQVAFYMNLFLNVLSDIKSHPLSISFSFLPMATIKNNAILLLVLFSCLCCVSQSPPKALVITFDGFRYNYPNISITPTLERIKTEGTHAKYFNNVFETKTFPNHHTIATGLYPDYHGVLASSFYDPVFNRVLKYSAEMWQYSNDVLPIWIHNEEHGRDRHSGVYMWPGSNFMYRNKLPTFIQVFNNSIPWNERVDTVLNWFLDPDTPANFVMMYFEEPDAHSHGFGPNSEEVENQIIKLDNTVNYLHQSLKQRNLSSSINVFFLSDHGMTAVPPQNLINVTHLINDFGADCLLAGSSPVLHVIPKPSIEDKVYISLKNLSVNNSFVVYRKNELPKEWLYKHNRRIPPIMIVANEGYAFDDIWRNGTKMYGVHGYDNRFKDMHPFFLAYGPRIKKNYTIEPFNAVDLFSAFCEVLHLNMEQTNGSLYNIRDLFIPNPEATVMEMSNLAIVMASLLISLLIFLSAVLIKNLYAHYILRKYDTKDGFSVSKEFENIHLLDSDEME